MFSISSEKWYYYVHHNRQEAIFQRSATRKIGGTLHVKHPDQGEVKYVEKMKKLSTPVSAVPAITNLDQQPPKVTPEGTTVRVQHRHSARGE